VSRIAIVGNLSVDRVAGAPPRPGGTVYHAARAAAHIGADAIAVTRWGVRDEALALGPLVSLGLPVAGVETTESTAFSFHYEGDRRVMVVDAVGDAWSPVDADTWAAESLAGCDWVIVGGLLRSHFDRAVLEALAGGRRRLLLDAHGLTRAAVVGPLREDAAFDRGLLRDLTALKLNEEEAAIVAGGLDQRSLEALGVPEVVLTLGSRGAVVVEGGELVEVAAAPVDGPVDPTGAGDAFSLVYVDGRARGLAPAAAAERAAAVVSELIAVP
jgi:sugar/nucleoside kinase (ribokinase family)